MGRAGKLMNSTVVKLDRAYGLAEVKAIDGEQRLIRGTATTPRPDRVGDVIEPLGVSFANPVPLLHQHDAHRPVGRATLHAPTVSGITFEASLPEVREAGALRDRVETAWSEVKAGLVRAVSIGFRVVGDGYEHMKGGGVRYLNTEILELSLVTVPANSDCTISTIKSLTEPSIVPAIPAPAKRSGFDGHAFAEAVVGAVKGYVEREFRPLAERVEALEGKGLSFEGTHQRGLKYRRGQAVVSDGSLWIATCTTTDKPGVSGDWALAAKAGRDARERA